MSHAEILASLCGIILVMYKCLMKQPLLPIEIIASIIAFGGSVII
jgi:hypothetical protein